MEIDKNEAFAQLAKTLNKLMSKLERTEKGKIRNQLLWFEDSQLYF